MAKAVLCFHRIFSNFKNGFAFPAWRTLAGITICYLHFFLIMIFHSTQPSCKGGVTGLMMCPLSKTMAVFSGGSCVCHLALHVSKTEDKGRSHYSCLLSIYMPITRGKLGCCYIMRTKRTTFGTQRIHQYIFLLSCPGRQEAMKTRKREDHQDSYSLRNNDSGHLTKELHLTEVSTQGKVDSGSYYY